MQPTKRNEADLESRNTPGTHVQCRCKSIAFVTKIKRHPGNGKILRLFTSHRLTEATEFLILRGLRLTSKTATTFFPSNEQKIRIIAAGGGFNDCLDITPCEITDQQIGIKINHNASL